MTDDVIAKLLALLLVVAIGYGVARMRWLGDVRQGVDPARVLGLAAFYLFVPALMLRTTARIPLEHLPWLTLAAFFAPALALLIAVYLWHRRRPEALAQPVAPSVRALTVGFGNSVQIGIPMAGALFGESGLGLHITIVSVHALTLLTTATALAELDLARAAARQGHDVRWLRALALSARNTFIHPFLLPVLLGLLLNVAGIALPLWLDEVLLLLSAAAVPLCLVLIGISLAQSGLRGRVRDAVSMGLQKLLLMPALVLGVAHWGFGLSGLPLAVVVVCAALPAGSNPLIFAQRYRTLEPEVAATVVLSTVAFVVTAPFWLWVLSLLA